MFAESFYSSATPGKANEMSYLSFLVLKPGLGLFVEVTSFDSHSHIDPLFALQKSSMLLLFTKWPQSPESRVISTD